MIRTLLITLFACLFSLSFAQPINSWPTGNAWWEIRYYDDFGNPTIFERIRNVDGDTIIQGQTFQKVLESTSLAFPGNYVAAVRSDSLGRVYVVPKDSASSLLLYDFSAQPGDTLYDAFMGAFGQAMGTTALVVQQKDTIILLDGPHLRLQVSDTAWTSLWIEVIDGIGTMNDFLYPMYWGSVSGWDQLVCMNRENVQVIIGQCIALGQDRKASGKPEIYPNPTSDQVRVECLFSEWITQAVLLDARGTPVQRWGFLPSRIDLSSLAPGLYLLQASGQAIQWTEKIIRH
jgi:hypothetical protein